MSVHCDADRERLTAGERAIDRAVRKDEDLPSTSQETAPVQGACGIVEPRAEHRAMSDGRSWPLAVADTACIKGGRSVSTA